MLRLHIVIIGCSIALATPSAARAQELLDLKSATLIRDEYRIDITGVHDQILALANAIPAEKYDWRPSPEVRTVAEVLMHVAGEWLYVVPISVGGKPPSDFGPPREAMHRLETITTKAEVLAQLEKAWTHCRAVLDAADPAQLQSKFEPAKMSLARATLRVSGDQHEHLGQLIAYARANGVTPPWSK